MTYKGNDVFRSDGGEPSLIDLMMPELPAMPDAACRGNPDPFWDAERWPEARHICAACPESAKCLSWALKTEARGGIFAGLNEDERRALA